MDEFAFIAERLSPLAASWPGAAGLTDDAALLDERWVVSVDTLVEGAHFFAEDPLDGVASKALLAAVSDLIAKASWPKGYLLSLTLPKPWRDEEAAAFCDGLARTQAGLGMALMGGDTARGGTALVVSATVFGAPEGQVPRRDGARPGDRLYVTGPIGAGLLALEGVTALRAALGPLEGSRRGALEHPHFLAPELTVGAIPLLAAHASASADISDGLAADVGHIARASGVGIVIQAERTPLPTGAAEAIAQAEDPDKALASLLTGGDDYVVAFTSPDPPKEVLDAGRRCGVILAEIGRVEPGAGVQVRTADGQVLKIERAGFTHF